MDQHLKMQFANFVCKFGEHMNLLDLAEEIVIPAFSDEELVRTFADTQYFIMDFQIWKETITDGETLLCLGGRFVKDTVLQRDQVYDDKQGRIVKSPMTMPSAPTSLFVLILNNHKLIYLPEVSAAPPLQAFSATIRKFIGQKRKEFLESEYKAARERGENRTKKSLRENIPEAKLTVVPLSSKESIESFVKGFRRLERLELRLTDTNEELDATAMWKSLRASKANLGADTTKVVHSNTKGLKKDVAVDQIHAAASSGNQLVTARGVDEYGNPIKGNNDAFQLSVVVSIDPTRVKDSLRVMLARFQSLVTDGALVVGSPVSSTKDKILSLIRQLL